MLVLIAGTWFVVERAIRPERYRPMITERLAKATGLPVKLGDIDLTLLPVPSAHVRDVVVGEGDFQAVCSDVVAYPRLASLGHGTIEIEEILLRGLVVTLPTDVGDARSRINTVVDSVSSATGDSASESGSQRLLVGTIRADGAHLVFGSGSDYALEGDIAVDDVLTKAIAIHGDGTIPLLGENARFTGQATVTRTGDPEMGIGVSGDVSVTGVDTETLVKTRNIPSAIANAKATFERTAKLTYRADISGDAAPKPIDGADMDSLSGPFTAEGWWDQGTFTLNGFAWQTAAAEIRGDVSVPSDGSVAAHVAHAQVHGEGLNDLLRYPPDLPFRLSATTDGTFSGDDVLLGLTPDHYLRLVQGTAQFEGINVATKSGETAYQGVSGDVTFEEGVIHVQRVASEGISLKGDVTPDFSNGVTAIDLSGQVDLTRERLRSLVDLPQISEAAGRVHLSRIKATIVPGEGMPADLVVEGDVKNGVLGIKSDAWNDRFAPLSATFTAQPGRIETKAQASSQKLGATTVDGQYLLDQREWRGTVQGDLSQMDLPFLKQAAAKDVAPGIVAAYGPSAFDITVQLPGPDQPRAAVTFARNGTPKLAGDVAWRKDGEAWALGDVKVDATIPGTALQAMLPDTATASGDMDVGFTRSYDQKRFVAHLTLDATDLTYGQYIHKGSGVVSSLDVTGEATADIWQAQSLRVECLGEAVQGRFESDRFIIDPLDLNVAMLAPLLARGGEAHGRIQGRVATNPTELDLTLMEFGAALSPDLTIDSVNGGISIHPDGVSVRDLAVVGANSDCHVTAEKRAGHWSGSVTGQQLDINGVENLFAAVKEYQGEPSEPADVTPASSPAHSDAAEPFTGSFSANLDALIYRQAHFTNASATVVAQNGHIQVENLRLDRNGGSITGTLTMASGEPTGQFSTEMVVTNVPAQVIDELAFVEPRGLKGNLNGTVILQMPTGEGVDPTHGMSGSIEFTGENGTFGKLGIATQILTVLRATEITRLRLPSVRDEGLSFDRCRGTITMNQGLMTVQDMEIRTPTYLIAARGTINFPANDTELLVHVNLLESVLSAGDLVPGVREVADHLRSAGGMRILVTGPPDNPSTRYGFGPPIVGEVTDDVLRTLKTTTSIVRDELVDRAADALRNILK